MDVDGWGRPSPGWRREAPEELGGHGRLVRPRASECPALGMSRIGTPVARPQAQTRPADLTALVEELLADASPGWTLRRNDTWCTATPAGRRPRDAGWKLHL